MGIASREGAITVGFLYPILGGILVAMRFYSRWQQKIPKQIDDWLCLPAWLCVTGACATLLVGIYKDAFANQTPTDPAHVTEQQHVLAQVTGALVALWMVAITLIKLSILCFFRRIFIGRIFDICTWTLIGLSFLWLVYAFFTWILFCGTDLQANFEGGWAVCPTWGLDIQMGVFCLDSFIDLALIILPIPFIWQLQLTLSRKLVLVVVFLIGGLAFVAGLANTVIQLVYLTHPDTVTSSNEGSFFQDSAFLYCNEIGVGLIACNLPSLGVRVAHSVPQQLRRGWHLSLSGIRHAASKLSLQSASRRDLSDASLPRTRDRSPGLDRYPSTPESLKHLRPSSSDVTIPDIPLVSKRSKASSPSEPSMAEEYGDGDSWKTLFRGFDNV